MLSLCDTTLERDEQTDIQTDIIAIPISRVSVLTRDKNRQPNTLCLFNGSNPLALVLFHAPAGYVTAYLLT